MGDSHDMKRSVLCLAALLTALPALCEEQQIRLDPANTKVEWTLGTVLHTVHGTFRLKRGDLHLDPAAGKISGQVVVDATSGESGSGARDSRMHKSILESGKYPEIVFAPDRIVGGLKPYGDSDIQLHGWFTIHGAAHEVTLAARVHLEGPRLATELNFTVPYIQWGMKNPSTLFLRVDDTVRITVRAAGDVTVASH